MRDQNLQNSINKLLRKSAGFRYLQLSCCFLALVNPGMIFMAGCLTTKIGR